MNSILRTMQMIHRSAMEVFFQDRRTDWMKCIASAVAAASLATATMAAEPHPPRVWTSTTGTTVEARLVEIGESTVTLVRKDGGAPLKVRLDQLSAADQTYLGEIQKKLDEGPTGATSIAGLDAAPGEIRGPIACKDGKWSYHLYLPKGFHDGRKWPVWFIMSPGGGDHGGILQRYVTGAERLGCILALSVESKNDFADSDLAMEAMADDVMARLPVLDGMCFSSGSSGGSRMAYLLAERNKSIAGVLASASGSGVYLKEKDFRDAQLRKSVKVYSLIGTNCFNRSEAVTSHEKLPADCRLRFFPGGHDWADSPYIEEAMARLHGAALMAGKAPDLVPLRRIYSRTMAAWMKEMVADQPWEAEYWADFLKDFPGDPSAAKQASEMFLELTSNPQVKLARDAEKDIRRFSLKHFNRYISMEEGRKPDPDRAAEAKKLAAKYPGLPHAEILEKLGDPS